MRHGAAYEAVMPTDFEFIGVFEFDDWPACEAISTTPRTRSLWMLFYTCNAAALAYDYEMPDAESHSDDWPLDVIAVVAGSALAAILTTAEHGDASPRSALIRKLLSWAGKFDNCSDAITRIAGRGLSADLT